MNIFKKKEPKQDEQKCPYDGIAYSKVPGYIEGYGCPVCGSIAPYHLPIPKPSMSKKEQEAK